MTPQYILRKSLCREPWCAGPHEFRGVAMRHWPAAEREAYLRQAESAIEDMGCAMEYAERQGYDQPRRGILFANWNYFCREVGDLLERAGFAVEWEDEWTTCDGCARALRTSPDSYSWQPAYLRTENSILCWDCLTEDDIAELEDNPQRAVNLDGVNLADYGYREVQCGYESGWHPGQNADPRAIYAEMVAHGHRRLLFQVGSVSQFSITFCVWEKIVEDDDEAAAA